MDYRRSELDLSRKIGLVESLDLYAPVLQTRDKPAVVFALDALTDVTDRESEAWGFFVQDRLMLTDKLRIVAGARYSTFDESLNVQTAAGASDSFSQSPVEWTAQLGGVFSPTKQVSIFASRTTSFVPTEGTRVGGAPLRPETGA